MYLITWIYRPLKDGWLSWPCWLTDSRRLNHKVVTHPASSLAQIMESSPAETSVLTTMLHRQLIYMILILCTILTWHFCLSVRPSICPSVSVLSKRMYPLSNFLLRLIGPATFLVFDPNVLSYLQYLLLAFIYSCSPLFDYVCRVIGLFLLYVNPVWAPGL